jgi:hypothetical protein
MEKLNLKKCDSLADVFYAVIGGKTDDIREIKEFIDKSPLKNLIYANDVERILQFDGFFADEVVDAIYALLPVKLRLSPELAWIMTPQAFRKLNAAQVAKPASRYVNVSISEAVTVYLQHYKQKIENVVKAVQEEKALGKNPLEPFEDKYVPPSPPRTFFSVPKKSAPKQETEDKEQDLEANADISSPQVEKKKEEQPKNVPHKKLTLSEIIDRLEQIKQLRALKTTPEEVRKELKKEANRLQTAKYRLENPDAWKKSYKKMSDLPPEKQAKRRAANNRRNDTFRSIHREELRVYHNNLRAKEKAENPEAVKEKDKKHNSSAEAKAAKKRYYEKNTQQVIERAIRHNKIKRFKQKTGPVILGLLQGIINSKIK